MKQLKIPFKRSLNPIPSLSLFCDIIYKWREYNRKGKANARYIGQAWEDITLHEYLKIKQIDLDKYINQPFDRLRYYNRYAKYKNGVRYGKGK